MSLLGFAHVDEASPFGDAPCDAPRRGTPDEAGLVWKAYHARQALLEGERQHGRSVRVDPVLWGDLLGRKLTELIERDRNNPRSYVRGGVTDRRGARCMLPELDNEQHYHGAGATAEPLALRFSDEGAEFTPECLGAQGDFSEMYHRRYRGYTGRSRDAGGEAGKRARGRLRNTLGSASSLDSHLRQLTSGGHARNNRDVRPRIPWSTGGSANSSMFEGGAGVAFMPGSGNNSVSLDERGDERPADVEPHDNVSIGPDAHRVVPEEVDYILDRQLEEGDGAHAFVAVRLGKRFVPMGGTGGGRKLRGTEAMERRREAARPTNGKDRYVEEVARRQRSSKGGAASSVINFQEFYVKSTQAADALPKVERIMENRRGVNAVVTPPLPDADTAAAAAVDGIERRRDTAARRKGGISSPGTSGSTVVVAPRSRRAESGGVVYPDGGEISVAGSTSSLGTGDIEDYRSDNFVSLPAPATRAHGASGGGGGEGSGGVRGMRTRRQGKHQRRLPPAVVTNRSSASFCTSLGPQQLHGDASVVCSADSLGGSAAATAASSVSTGTEPLPPCPVNSGRRAGVPAYGGIASVAAAAAAAPPPPLGVFSGRRAADADGDGGDGDGGGASASLSSASLMSSDAETCSTGGGFPPMVPERRGFDAPTVSCLNSGGVGSGDNSSRSSSTDARLSWSVRGQEVGVDAPAKMLSLANGTSSSISSCSTAEGCVMDYYSVDSVPNSVSASRLSSSGTTTVDSVLMGRLVTGVSMHDIGGGGGKEVAAGVSGKAWQRAERKRGRRRRGDVGSAHKIDLGSKKQQEGMKLEVRTSYLIGACEWGDLAALERLLELGASPLDSFCPAVEGSRCVLGHFFLFILQVAAGLRSRLASDDALHDQALAMLVKAGLEGGGLFLSSPALQDEDDRGFHLLHHAAAFGNVHKTEFLLERGARPNSRAKGGNETALMIAAKRGQRDHVRVAASLLAAGADLSAVDCNGMTALHHAAGVGRRHMCLYLLLVGAKKTTKDNEGRTPQDVCWNVHPRAYATLRSFVGCEPPPAAILDYMEKVEVQGLGDSDAHSIVLLAYDGQQGGGSAVASKAAASAVLADDDSASITSWDTLSLGGVSGAGASLISLGSLASS